jgi:3-phosphoshikimate 1-carboxyvinyltransferase
MGAQVISENNSYLIKGVAGLLSFEGQEMDVGNSGLALRFAASAASLSSTPLTITGDHSISHLRPMGPLIEGLAQLGVDTVYHDKKGYAPLTIQGPLKEGRAVVHGEDSQTVTALLIAAAASNKNCFFKVKKAGEKPWVAMTLHWLRKLGVTIECKNYAEYHVETHRGVFNSFHYTVATDASSLIFPLAAAVVTNSYIKLKNVTIDPLQRDIEVLFLLKKMGAQIDIDEEKKTITCTPSKNLTGIAIDVSDFIDAVPILAAVACFAKGKTVIKGAKMARFKECDRLHASYTELKKMGALIEEKKEGLVIQGAPLKGAHLQSYKDHRMALSLSVAALGAEGPSRIFDVGCVDKTYPTFYKDIKKAGANIKILS